MKFRWKLVLSSLVILAIASAGCVMSFGGDRVELGDDIAIVGGSYSDSLGMCLDIEVDGAVLTYCPDIDLEL